MSKNIPGTPWSVRWEELTADEIVSQDSPAVMRNVYPAVNLKRAAFVFGGIIRLKCSISLHINAPLLEILNEKAFHHALVNEQEIRI